MSIYAGVAVIAAVTGAAVVWLTTAYRLQKPTATAPDLAPQQMAELPPETFTAHLYFADKDNVFLVAEERRLRPTGDATDLSRQVLEALIAGPSGPLARTIPPQTTVLAVHITAAGICYVDLSAELAETHPGGVQSELLTLYSIVNSLTLNVPGIQTVKILVDGQETMTLAGHIDLQEPFAANMLLIR